MKKISLLVLLLSAMAATLAGCSKDSNEQKIDDPAPPVELKLSSQWATVDKSSPVDRHIRIVSGNGGYRIVLPKKIMFATWVYEKSRWEHVDVDYSDEILALQIYNDQTVIVERKLLTDQNVAGFFMVTDNKGKKKIFVVTDTFVGDLPDSYFDDIKDRLLNDPDYWQE